MAQCGLRLSNMRIRQARDTDRPLIHTMGYDAWSEGAPLDQHIQSCIANGKYKKGTWFALENDAGEIVSALICYKNAFGLQVGSAGIGSVATLPSARKKGYADFLVRGIVGQLLQEGTARIFLYSDIPPAYYARMGFQALPASLQKHLPSVCMMLQPVGKTDAVPDYF